MNRQQIELIAAERFPRLGAKVVEAVAEVIVDGSTSYAAEKNLGITRGTVSRYVLRFQAEVDFVREVAKYDG